MTHAELKQQAKALPKLPGIYIMKDEADFVIYVGKSKSLKDRVSSYFGSLRHAPPKVSRLVAAIDHFDIQLTDTELDALLLECQLIKQYRPLYNRLLKNDKSYKYICLKEAVGSEVLSATYQIGKEGKYYGPYDRHVDLTCAVEALRAYYKLPNCKTIEPLDNCLTYRLKNCCAPCIESATYKSSLEAVAAFLEGTHLECIVYYEKRMQEAAEVLDFDAAIKYRQFYLSLKRLCYRQEAAQLALSCVLGVAFVPLPTGGLKAYYLRGATIISTCLFKARSHKTTRYKHSLLALQAILNQKALASLPFKKEEVDYHLILYSYLNTHDEVQYLHQHTNESLEDFVTRLIH